MKFQTDARRILAPTVRFDVLHPLTRYSPEILPWKILDSCLISYVCSFCQTKGSHVVCPNCGQASEQFQRCDSCGKPIPATSKIVEVPADKFCSSPRVLDTYNVSFNHRKVVNTYSNVRIKRRPTHTGTRTKAARLEPGKTQSSSLTFCSRPYDDCLLCNG